MERLWQGQDIFKSKDDIVYTADSSKNISKNKNIKKFIDKKKIKKKLFYRFSSFATWITSVKAINDEIMVLTFIHNFLKKIFINNFLQMIANS